MTDADDVFHTTPPREDAGSNTLNRFFFQTRAATRDALALYAAHLETIGAGQEPPPLRIVCERHEDYAVLRGSEVELVSVKHRDLNRGVWTLTNSITDGGIAHLYRNWCDLGRLPTCRLVTNSDFSSASSKDLIEVCGFSRSGTAPPPGSERDKTLSAVATEIAAKLIQHRKKTHLTAEHLLPGSGTGEIASQPSAALVQRVRDFIGILVLDRNLPARDYFDAAAPEKFVKPVLAKLGAPTSTCRPVWREIHSLICSRMEDDGETKWGGLAQLVQALHNGAGDPALHTQAARRTLTTARIGEGIQQIIAASSPLAYLSVPDEPPRTKLEAKMRRGGCDANMTSGAAMVMNYWRRQRGAFLDDSPGQHCELEMLRMDLQSAVQDVSRAVVSKTSEGEQYGAELWSSIRTIDPEQVVFTPFKLDRHSLAGAVAELADDCLVWFSPRFDAKQAVELDAEERLRELAEGE